MLIKKNLKNSISVYSRNLHINLQDKIIPGDNLQNQHVNDLENKSITSK